MPGFPVRALTAVMASNYSVAMAQAEASLGPSLHDGVLKCGVSLFWFAHAVAIWCVVGDVIVARVIGTVLGF